MLVVILVALGLVGWKAYVAHRDKKPSNQSNVTAKTEIVITNEGTQQIKMIPGKTTVTLPSGAWLLFGNGGSQYSVPDFVFGEKYILGDTPNYVPIKKLTKTYDRGYLYTLTNKGCHTERKFDTDVYITVVSSCDIEVMSQKAAAPTVSRMSFTKQASTSEKAGTTLGMFKDEPYLFVSADSTRLTKTTDGKKVYLEHGDWPIRIITNFGQGIINYTAEELYARQTKSITIGSSKVEIKNINLTCTAPYGPDAGCHASLGDQGAVYDRFDFTVNYTSVGNDEPKIVDYQE